MCKWTPFKVETSSSLAGLELRTTRSVGQRITHWATGAPSIFAVVLNIIRQYYVDQSGLCHKIFKSRCWLLEIKQLKTGYGTLTVKSHKFWVLLYSSHRELNIEEKWSYIWLACHSNKQASVLDWNSPALTMICCSKRRFSMQVFARDVSTSDYISFSLVNMY